MRPEAPGKGNRDLTIQWGTLLDSISLSLGMARGLEQGWFSFSFFHTDSSFQKHSRHEQTRALAPPL